MAMTIANFIGLVDTFTFPHNPQVFDVAAQNNMEIKRHAHYNYATVISTGGVLPKSIILNGHFDGSSKRTNLNDLTKHIQQSQHLKMLIFEATKFHLVVGNQVKETNSGRKTNYIDYVAAFTSIVPGVFSSTLKTHTDGGAEQTNAGTGSTFVFEIAGTYDGTGDVVLGDSLGNSLTVASGAFSGTEKVIYRLVVNVPSGSGTLTYVTEYGYVGIQPAYTNSGTTTSATAYKLNDTGGTPNFSATINVGDLVKNTTDGSYTIVTKVDSNTILSLRDNIMASTEAYVIYHQTRKVSTTTGSGVLELGASATTADISATNLSATYTIQIRDAWRN